MVLGKYVSICHGGGGGVKSDMAGQEVSAILKQS